MKSSCSNMPDHSGGRPIELVDHPIDPTYQPRVRALHATHDDIGDVVVPIRQGPLLRGLDDAVDGREQIADDLPHEPGIYRVASPGSSETPLLVRAEPSTEDHLLLVSGPAVDTRTRTSCG